MIMFPADQPLCLLKIFSILLLKLFVDFFAGFINSIPFLVDLPFFPTLVLSAYYLMLYPRKSTPSFILTNFVFPSLSFSPQGFRNFTISSFAFSSSSVVSANTVMSSAKRTGNTFGFPFLVLTPTFNISSSIPFKVILNKVADIASP